METFSIKRFRLFAVFLVMVIIAMIPTQGGASAQLYGSKEECEGTCNQACVPQEEQVEDCVPTTEFEINCYDVEGYTCEKTLTEIVEDSERRARIAQEAREEARREAEREAAESSGKIENPIGSQDFKELLNRIINFFMIFAGSVATLMVVYAGFLYTTSAGSTTQTEKAKSVIKHAVIGYIIVMFAYAIQSIVGSIF